MADEASHTIVVQDRFGTITAEFTIQSGEIVVGRSRDCDVILPSEKVSRRHARFFVADGDLFVEDLKSSNGVYVDGERIEGKFRLDRHCAVRMGDYHLHVGDPGDRATGAKGGGGNVFVRLVGRNTIVADEIFELNRTTTVIGRGKDVGLTLVDPSVSRVHGRILVKPDGTVIVEDVGSANGVFVNDKRVKVWELEEGDILRFGNVEFLVEIPSADTMETSARPAGLAQRLLRTAFGSVSRVLVSLLVMIGAAALVLLALDLPSADRDQAVPGDGAAIARSDAIEGDPGPPGPVFDAAANIRKAGELLKQRKLKEAGALVEQVVEHDPLNQDATRLRNRITVETEIEKTLAAAVEAMTEGRIESAASFLLQVPTDSIYRDQARTQLAELLGRLKSSARKACRRKGRKSMECIRLDALAAKVEAASKDEEP